MSNKYLEKIAGLPLGAMIGAVGGARGSKDGDGLGGAVAGAAAGHVVDKSLGKVMAPPLHKAMGNFSKVIATPKGRMAHVAAMGTGLVAAGAASLAGTYYGGKAGGKLYSKAKDKALGRKKNEQK